MYHLRSQRTLRSKREQSKMVVGCQGKERLGMEALSQGTLGGVRSYRALEVT